MTTTAPPSTPAGPSRLESLLLELLAIPSPTGEEGAIAERAAELLACTPAGQAGLHRQGNRLVAGPARPDGRPTVALVGHLDTVPQGSCGPPRLDGSRIWGRGACDMKGGLACMLLLAERLDPMAKPYRTLFVLYDGEEGDQAANGLEPLLAADAPVRAADFALVLEPTGGALQLGALGSLHVLLRVRGKAAHSARPWLGENAICRAMPVLAALASVPRRDVEIDGLRYRESVSLTRLHAGGARNVIPDLLEANVNVRFAPDRSPEDALQDLELLLPAGHPAELELVDRSPAALPCRSHPILDALRRTGDLPLEPKQAWTDVARLAAHGIPAANFGPGDPALAHRDDEHVERAALRHCYETLERFLGGRGA